MQNQNQEQALRLVDVNRLFLWKLLIDEPNLNIWLKWTLPCLGESNIHPGESALILKCETEKAAMHLAKNMPTLIGKLKNSIPFAEIRIEMADV